MVKNDLIDRYIYAVTKHMKSAMKKDVAAELETIIQDMLPAFQIRDEGG